MTVQELFRSIDFTGKEIKPYSDGSFLLKNDFPFFFLKGGYFVFGANAEGEVFGLPLDEIGKIKKTITAWGKDRDDIKLRCVVQNVDSRAERFALLVKSTPSLENRAQHDPVTSSASSFDSFLSFARRVGLTPLDSGSLLAKATELSSDSRFSNGFSLLFDESQNLANVVCKIYQGKETNTKVLDVEELFGSLSTLASKSYLFLERNSLIEDSRRSYPKTAFFLAFAFCLSHLDISEPKQIEIRLFPDRAEIVCPGLWDEDNAKKNANQGIAQGLSLAGLPSEKLSSLFEQYSEVPDGYLPSLILGPHSYSLRLMDLLYQTKEEKALAPADGSLSEEQKKVLKVLSSGPRPLSYLMKLSPYKSRAAYSKFVINPLLERKRIVRVGKLTSPKAILCIADE